MYPHERSLVERMADRPFALLGVNTDDDLSELRRVIQRERINWRSWWDGGDGQIVSAWGVQSFPTLYLIDHHGVIRYQNPRGGDLDAAIEELVAAAEAAR